MRVARINWEFYWALIKPMGNGDHLDRVHSEKIKGGRLVLVIGGQESQTSSRDQQAQVHSDQMVLVMARRKAIPCERRSNSRATFSDDAQMKVGKQLLAAMKPSRKETE